MHVIVSVKFLHYWITKVYFWYNFKTIIIKIYDHIGL